MVDYLVRANFDFTLAHQCKSEGGKSIVPSEFPVGIGPFTLDISPNALIYLADIGAVSYSPSQQDKPDWGFPISQYYLEGPIEINDSDSPELRADEILESLEFLFRLFQPGDVSVRRHRIVEFDGRKERTPIFLPWRPINPITEPLYERGAYRLGDDVILAFVDFFRERWDALGNLPPHLVIALTRFNSSYERRELGDRLIDLVVALEALFGDGEPGSIAFKVANRCACWLHPIGTDRFTTFCAVRKFYSMRSRAIHVGKAKDISEDQIDELEEIVRASLRRFLDYQLRHSETPKGKRLDNLIMAGRICYSVGIAHESCIADV